MANRKQDPRSFQSHQQAKTERASPIQDSHITTCVNPIMQINQGSLDEGLETTHGCPPCSTKGISWDGVVSSTGPNAHFPFETVDPKVLHKNAGTFKDLTQPSNTFSPGNSSSASESTLVGPGPSGTSIQAHFQPTAQAHKYRCTTCQKTFDRASRLDKCRNGHSSLKPYKCFGACGRLECPALYASSEKLERHVDRHLVCPSCGKRGLKQNMARHKASCRGAQ